MTQTTNATDQQLSMPGPLTSLSALVTLFDHCGLFGLMADARKLGWTDQDVQERAAALAIAVQVLDAHGITAGTMHTRRAAGLV